MFLKEKLPPFSIAPHSLWFWGKTGLLSALAGGLALLLLITAFASYLLPYLALAIVGGIGIRVLYRHPLLNLCFTIAAFSVVTDFEEGIQIREALYGFLYIGFLSYWFISRIFFFRDNILKTGVDYAVAGFLIWVTASFGLTSLFGGEFSAAIVEWTSVIFIAFYFPVKEACVRYKNGARAILITIVLLGLFAAVRNFVSYRALLESATAVWNIVAGRVVTNEILLVISGLASIVLLIHSKTWKTQVFYLCIANLLLVSLILTQSRAYWIDYALGIFVLLFVLEIHRRIRLLGILIINSVFLLITALIVSPELVSLILTGLSERLLSLGSATTQDISLINRFYESRAVIQKIISNPILGYGLGVSYTVFDIIEKYTMSKTFAHNGFLMIWFKYGFIGLVLVLYTWMISIRNAFRAGNSNPDHYLCIYGIIAFIGLLSMFPSTNTSVQFFLSDTNLAFALLIGWANGIYARMKNPLSDT